MDFHTNCGEPLLTYVLQRDFSLDKKNKTTQEK